MFKNTKSQESKSFMQREDWIAFLTRGLVSSGAIGWLVYRNFKAQSLDCKAIMRIVASFAGGMGIYFTGSALFYMVGKSDDKREHSVTFQKEELVTDPEKASQCKRFVNVLTELEKKFEASKAKEYKCLNKRTLMTKPQGFVKVSNKKEDVPQGFMKVSNKKEDVPQGFMKVSNKKEDVTKRLNDSNRKGPRKVPKISLDNQQEICSNEAIVSRMAKFREEILSYLSELKGYVQGTIDPLPSARKLHFISSEMSDEMRRQVVMIVKEYANSLVPKFEHVVNEFVNSVGKAVKALDCDKEHEVKRAFETLGVSEKDLTAELLKIEMGQYYNALENATKNKSFVSSSKKDQRYEDTLETNMQPPVSIFRPSLRGKYQGVRDTITKCPALQKLKIPTSSISLMSEETNKSGLFAEEKTENTQSDPRAEFILTEEQRDYLNIFRYEI